MMYVNGQTSTITRLTLVDSTTGAAKTGLSTASAGLIISTVASTEASGTAYSGANIETITTCGTYAAPTGGKVRFKEVDATNHPGLYEIQAADARWAVSAARHVVVTVQATGVLTTHKEVQLTSVDFGDAVRFGLSALPNAAAGANGGLPLAVDSSGRVDVLKVNGTSQTAGDIYARLGAPAGASMSADIAAVKSDSGAIKTKTDSLTFTVAGQVDANTLKVGGTTQTARDLGASVLLSTGTGTGQLDFTSGRVKADTVYWNAAAVSVPTNAGVPNVNAKTWNDLATVELPLVPTTAGRKLDVSAGGEAGLDWANIGAPTTTVALSGTTVGTVTTYTGNTVQTGDAYARLGAPAGASVSADVAAVKVDTAAIKAKTDNLPAAPAAVSNIPTVAQIWEEAIASHSGVSGSMAEALAAAGAAGDPWNTALPGAYAAGKAGYIIGNALDATVSSRLASASYTAPDNTSITGIKAKTDSLTFTVAGQVDSNTLKIGGTTQTAGDIFARLGAPAGASMSADIAGILTRLGAPAGASVSADIAAVKVDSAAIKTKTDSLGFTVAGMVNANIRYVNGTQVQGDGGTGTEWGPV